MGVVALFKALALQKLVDYLPGPATQDALVKVGVFFFFGVGILCLPFGPEGCQRPLTMSEGQKKQSICRENPWQRQASPDLFHKYANITGWRGIRQFGSDLHGVNIAFSQ